MVNIHTTIGVMFLEHNKTLREAYGIGAGGHLLVLRCDGPGAKFVSRFSGTFWRETGMGQA